MKKPFKFRYVNQVVGGFVLLIVAALLIGVILAGMAQQWFNPRFELHVVFPPDGSGGIKQGAEVVILGTVVGSVDQVTVDDDGNMEGVLTINHRFSRFIRDDSRAVLKKKFGVAGDAFVEITKGLGPPLTGNILPLPAEMDAELLDAMQELLEQVREAVMPVLEQVRKAVEEYTGVAADLRRPDGNVQRILANVEALTAGLERGEGTVGQVLKQPETLDNVNAAITRLNALLVALNDAMATVRARLEQTEGILDDVQRTTGHLPEALWQTHDTLREAEVLLDGLQKHWLLRKYMEPTAPSERIAPEELTAEGRATP